MFCLAGKTFKGTAKNKARIIKTLPIVMGGLGIEAITIGAIGWTSSCSIKSKYAVVPREM